MRRVAVTGLGIVCPIGNDKDEVSDSLRTGRSGIAACRTYREMGFRSHVHGGPNIDLSSAVKGGRAAALQTAVARTNRGQIGPK